VTTDDPVELCAAGESAWHAAAYAGLGSAWESDGAIAWAPGGVPHRLLLAAITLTPRTELPADLLARPPGIVCDSWAALTAADLPGWTRAEGDPWMIRDPAPCVVPVPAPVTVERTMDELLFEETAFRGGGGSPPARTGELHPTGSASFAGMSLFLARLDGHPVGTALAVEHERGVVVSGVAVLESARGRGIGAALTAAAVNAAPDLPATLSASHLGLPVYRRLGFRQLTSSVRWQPPATGSE
jgi:GNAT superfamily N-acetyltransferase